MSPYEKLFALVLEKAPNVTDEILFDEWIAIEALHVIADGNIETVIDLLKQDCKAYDIDHMKRYFNEDILGADIDVEWSDTIDRWATNINTQYPTDAPISIAEIS